MRRRSTPLTTENKKTIRAGAAGGGAGVAFAAVVNLVPNENLKQCLNILAPVLTVVISALFIVAEKIVVWEVSKRLIARARMEVQEKMERARNDPDSSPEYIQELRDMLEKLERAELDRIWKYTQLV
jgi:hypothetical protein